MHAENSVHEPSRRTGATRRGRARRRLLTLLAPAALLAVPALAAGASLQITEAGPGVTGLQTPDHIAQTLLGPGVTLDGAATINGSADAGQYDPSLPSFGRFTDGTADLGIGDGLVITANGYAGSFAGTVSGLHPASSRTDADLFGVVDDAGLCGAPSAAACVYNATSLEFQVRPTSRYVKFEYALAITETGLWNGGTEQWTGNVFGYPDGLALFVDGTAVADNCAVVPQTSTYLTMQTAGIVPPIDGGSNRAAAQANLDARVADPGAPNGFAYAAADNGWSVRFLTVPLTCVVDVEEAATAGDPVTVKIVAGDVNDAAVSPAVFLKAGSVRFSDDATPSALSAPGAPAAPVATAGDGTAHVTWSAPADDGGAAVTGYTVTAAPGGKTCTVAAPATSCTISGLTNGTAYTFTVAASNAVGSGAPSASSASVTPSAAPTPPAPTPPADQVPPPAPVPAPAPAAPSSPPATPLAPPATRPAAGPGQAAMQVVHRLQFDEVGRYTFIYVDSATGKRIPQLRGSRIGRRTITRRLVAPVLRNQKAGTRLVLASRLARRALAGTAGKVSLRIVLRRPDGTLSAVTVGADGTLTDAGTSATAGGR